MNHVCNIFREPSAGCTQQEYADLLSRVSVKSVFDTWQWIEVAYRHLPADVEPIFVTCRDGDGRLVGALPLKLETRRMWGASFRTLYFVQDPLGDQMIIPGDPGILPLLIRCVQTQGPAFDALQLNEIRISSVNSPVAEFNVTDTEAAGLIRTEIRRTPVVEFAGCSSSEHSAGYTKRMAGHLRRSRKKIAPYDPEISITSITPSDVPALLHDLKEVEDDSWKGDGQIGIFSTPERISLFKNLSEELARSGYLMIGTIRVNGEVITYRYGFLFENVFYDYNIAYKKSYSHLGVGRLLLDEMILACADRKCAAFDGSRTAQNTTNLLAERDVVWVPHERWMAFSPSLMGFYAQFIHRAAKPVGRHLRWRVKNWQAMAHSLFQRRNSGKPHEKKTSSQSRRVNRDAA